MAENRFAKYLTPSDVGPTYEAQDPIVKAAPSPAAPTPFQIEDQAMQRNRDARQQAQWEASHNPDGSEKPKIISDGKPTEYQSKSAGFLGRMLQAEKFYADVPEDSRDPRTNSGQFMHDWAPDMENSLPTFLGGNSPDRQKSDQAALNFIAASLRQESGAAITASEYDRQYRIFYPSPGDSPEQLAQKAATRQQAIEGFRIAAGPEAKKIEADPSKPIVRSGRTGMAYNFEVPEGADDAAILAIAKEYLQSKEPGEDRNPVFNPPRNSPASGSKVINFEDLP